MKRTCSENKPGWHGLRAGHKCIEDEVNRLKSLCGTSEGARYEYRADGMRVMKIADLTISWNPNDTEEGSGFYDEILSVNKPTTRYFYDGQMPMEEDFKITGGFGSPTVTVTQYGLGARGIDYIRNVHHSSGASVVFPIYDGHGNMVYTLSRGGNDTFSLGNKRIYDAWGDLRYDGNPNAGPNTQYCANLGHKKDNETDLIYMRARYYEPWTGRFISEDPARHSSNWFAYCLNSPPNYVDESGQTPIQTAIMAIYNALGLFLGMQLGYAILVIIFNRVVGFPYDRVKHIAGSLLVIAVEAADLAIDLLDTPAANKSITELARSMRRSLARTGFGKYVTSFRLAFTVGLMIGAFSAVVEFTIWIWERENA